MLKVTNKKRFYIGLLKKKRDKMCKSVSTDSKFLSKRGRESRLEMSVVLNKS